MYDESKPFLKYYNRKGNAIITATDELAVRIRQDFPDYQIEASAVQDVTNYTKLEKAIDSKLYDTIVLPIYMNDDTDFLKIIKDKKQIRLFLNVECSYTCPKKVCYGTTSKINAGKEIKMQCSFWDLKMPRTFYNDEIDWSTFYFDKSKFDAMGFNKYKLVPPWEDQQRTWLMYKSNSIF